MKGIVEFECPACGQGLRAMVKQPGFMDYVLAGIECATCQSQLQLKLSRTKKNDKGLVQLQVKIARLSNEIKEKLRKRTPVWIIPMPPKK